jgi:hypothetical protein
MWQAAQSACCGEWLWQPNHDVEQTNSRFIAAEIILGPSRLLSLIWILLKHRNTRNLQHPPCWETLQDLCWKTLLSHQGLHERVSQLLNWKHTLWLCQNSYWEWWFIVDLPMKNDDFPICSIVFCMELPEATNCVSSPWGTMTVRGRKRKGRW